MTGLMCIICKQRSFCDQFLLSRYFVSHSSSVPDEELSQLENSPHYIRQVVDKVSLLFMTQFHQKKLSEKNEFLLAGRIVIPLPPDDQSGRIGRQSDWSESNYHF